MKPEYNYREHWSDCDLFQTAVDAQTFYSDCLWVTSPDTLLPMSTVGTAVDHCWFKVPEGTPIETLLAIISYVKVVHDQTAGFTFRTSQDREDYTIELVARLGLPNQPDE
jgi:hypothetical protein